jgi:hypothetical protein
MAKAKKKKAAKKAGKAPKVFTLGGSPITIGGGSVTIKFKNELDYPPGTDPHDHENAAKKKLGTLKITDASGKAVDFSPLVSGNPDLCQIIVFYHDPIKKIDGTITVKGGPQLGINFDSDDLPTTTPNVYRNANAKITSVELGYSGGWGITTFAEPTIGKCSIEVDTA